MPELTSDFDATLVATDDLRYLPPQLELFASRHDPAANTMLLDREIADRFKTNFTALMYHLELESGAEEHGANHEILLKAISLEIVRPIFANRQAIELEDELFIFYESSDAVLAVLTVLKRPKRRGVPVSLFAAFEQNLLRSFLRWFPFCSAW